ncbi:uncharacterized protein LOC143147689 [Ptiloglossa arizonensis]|uniref:uncharacterized protein LOC143147689 n=1 Tax=Ptiloglossa arizonensis TaxID=3350558 RepID=UPI003F9FD4EE
MRRCRRGWEKEGRASQIPLTTPSPVGRVPSILSNGCVVLIRAVASRVVRRSRLRAKGIFRWTFDRDGSKTMRRGRTVFEGVFVVSRGVVVIREQGKPRPIEENADAEQR